MRVLICGDRDYKDESLVWTFLDGLYLNHDVGWLTVHANPFIVIEGQCPKGGADKFAETWCKNSPLHGPLIDLKTFDPVTYAGRVAPVVHLPFPADWNRHHKAAGPIRNRVMLEELNKSQEKLVLAFHDDLAASKGTADMCRISRKADVKVIHVEVLS